MKAKKFLKKFKDGTITMFKEFFNKKTNKKQRANMWSFLRLITPFVTIIVCLISLFVENKIPFLIAAGIITALGAITDYFDGRSARKYNSTSEYGKQLDQVSDKVFATVLGINLAIINPIYILIIVGEFAIILSNGYFKFKYNKVVIASTNIGKFKQWPLFIALTIGFVSKLNNILYYISVILVLITFILQIISAISYIRQNTKK